MKKVRGIIIAICLAVIALGVWKIVSIQTEYAQGEKTYENLEVHIAMPKPVVVDHYTLRLEGEEPQTETEWHETITEETVFPTVDFVSLQTINAEIIGWLYCEGTSISYPVVQGDDNSYYLNHLFDRTRNSSGSVFLDSRNWPDLSDRNSILYGHNMKNGSMFASLTGYKDQAFYEEHPRFLLMTPGKNYTIDVFSSTVVSEEDGFWKVEFQDDAEFDAWLQSVISRSKINTGTRPGPDDRVVTFSTCSYEYEGARFIVTGILREAK